MPNINRLHRSMHVDPKIHTAGSDLRVKQFRALVDFVFTHKPRNIENYVGYVVYKANDRILELSRTGGDAYDRALMTVKYTWHSPAAFHESLKVLGC